MTKIIIIPSVEGYFGTTSNFQFYPYTEDSGTSTCRYNAYLIDTSRLIENGDYFINSHGQISEKTNLTVDVQSTYILNSSDYRVVCPFLSEEVLNKIFNHINFDDISIVKPTFQEIWK